MQEQGGNRGSFFLNVNLVFLSQIATYGLAFGLRVVLARGLGDEGLGTYALFFLVVIVAGGIINLGIGLGNIYFLNKGPHSFRVLLANSLSVLAVTSVLTWILIAAYGLITEPQFLVSGPTFWLYAAALPGVVGYVLLTSFLHGSSRFLALAAVATAQGLSGLLIVTGLYAFGTLDVFGALAAWAGSFLLADLLALLVIGVRNVDIGGILRPNWAALKDQVRYGAQGQIANLAQLFNYRLDQFLVAAFISRAAVGHYTVAVGLGESVWWISSAVAMVLLPRLTQMDSERARKMTPLISRNVLFVSIAAAAALIVVSPILIRVLFGGDFTPAQTPLLLLMPGVIAASAGRVLGSYLFSQGRVIYNTYATFIALGVTLALDLVLIPTLKIEGAAIASSVAYVVSLAATLYWYRQVSGGGVWDALIVRPSDRHFYVELWHKLRARVRPAVKKAT